MSGTTELRRALERRYPRTEWILSFEVPSGTRRIDAMAVNAWHSRGHVIHAFELKSSRSDWLRELRHPRKAEETACHCDSLTLVTTKDVVREGELPATWGHLELRGQSLTELKKPEIRAFREQIDRAFVARLLRHVTGGNAKELEERLLDGQRRALEEARTHFEERHAEQIRQITVQQAEIKQICELLGIAPWNVGEGHYVRQLLQFLEPNGRRQMENNLNYIQLTAKDIMEKAEKMQSALALIKVERE